MRTTALIAALSLTACDGPAPAPTGDAGADAAPDVTVRPAPEGFRARLAPDGTLTIETGRVTLAGFDLVVRPAPRGGELFAALRKRVRDRSACTDATRPRYEGDAGAAQPIAPSSSTT